MSWQQRIGFWFKRHFPRVQFIVTSHSPFVCQAADPNGLIVLPGVGDDDVPRHLDAKSFARVRHGTIDQAVLSALFGLERTRSPESQALVDEFGDLRALENQGLLAPGQKERLAILRTELGF